MIHTQEQYTVFYETNGKINYFWSNPLTKSKTNKKMYLIIKFLLQKDLSVARLYGPQYGEIYRDIVQNVLLNFLGNVTNQVILST